VGCKWVFTVKYTPTGLIDRYKARLVAQGFSQSLGDDYLETFSPTIRAESLRVLLAIGALEDLEIRQIDVVSAYPRAQLHTIVYIRPPKALRAPKGTVLLL
jgi:Reverse transcriptase (RNA-dependent DNA polymerase)